MLWGIIGLLVLSCGLIYKIQKYEQLKARIKKDQKETQRLENQMIKNEQKEEQRILTVQENLQQEFEIRVKELELDLTDALYVLRYFYEAKASGSYIYMWCENNSLAIFNAPKTYGTFRYQESPRKWTVEYISKDRIHGLKKLNDYCKLIICKSGDQSNLNIYDNREYIFDLVDYQSIHDYLSSNKFI